MGSSPTSGTIKSTKLPMWYVYILKCSDNSLYTGVSTDVERRLKEHNAKNSRSKYTRSRQPVELVHTESCASKSEALKRENEIKRLSSKEKRSIITS